VAGRHEGGQGLLLSFSAEGVPGDAGRSPHHPVRLDGAPDWDNQGHQSLVVPGDPAHRPNKGGCHLAGSGPPVTAGGGRHIGQMAAATNMAAAITPFNHGDFAVIAAGKHPVP